ncbi:acetylglutamate kinase [Gemmatimonadetes bacterium T265]|nr:acetylglutamate kinase [Gemmatimonadetes bacterium T265]
MTHHGLPNGPLAVVKIGGRPQADPALPAALAECWRATDGRLVVVHGGGDAVSELQRARGVEPRFVGGRRVTTPADLDVLRMALSGLANKQLVAALRGAGVPAFGCSGEDGALLTATRTADAALGAVGVPARVDAAVLDALLRAGCCPVISPVSADADAAGSALNVNGDDAAAAVAAALGAAELFFLADVPGVLVDGAPVAELDPAGARALVADGTAAGGMAAKLDAALVALGAGVRRVRVGDVAALADPSRGTAVVATAGVHSIA